MHRLPPPLLLLATLAACAPSPPVGLAEGDRAAIQQAHEAFEQAVNTANWDAIMALYAPDAIVLPPNGRAVQGAAIRDLFAGMPPVAGMDLYGETIEGSGDYAWVSGRYTANMTLPGGAAAIPDSGKYVEIWQRQADGGWKMIRDIWNSDLSLPAIAPPQ